MSDTVGVTVSAPRRTLLVVDGHSLAFRAFFALPAENFTTSTGQETNAIWGFATMLAQVIDAEKPDDLAVAFDVKGGTFRNTLLPQYKGTRDAAPEELLSQLPLIQEMLDGLGVTYIEKPGYEGDDIIGTLATMGKSAGDTTLVLSGDRDAFQLVDDDITVLYPGHHFKDLKHMTPAAIQEKYHVTPRQYPDLAALRGETADNIPGVPGVGDGYAAKWINEYGSLDGILEHADEIGGKKGQALRENADQVRLNRKVNALVRDLDLGVGVGDLGFGAPDSTRLDGLFGRLEFGSRTKTRILRAFHAQTSSDSGRSAGNGAGSSAQGVTEATEIDDADVLRRWITHAVDAATDPLNATTQAIGDEAGTPNVDHSLRCVDLVRSPATWVLHAEGTAKPAQAHVDRLLLFAGGQMAILPESVDPACKALLQQLIDQRHQTMIVNGYKEHLHKLQSMGLTLRMPLFDTKLAGYLVHPDFHAETLERAVSHFLGVDVNDRHKATQGQLSLDDDEQVAQAGESNSESIAHANDVKALADYLAPIIDAREQFGLLRSIELPVSEVLYRMECAGASVDMGRLREMRDTSAVEARDAQEIAWQSAGSRVNLQSPKQLQAVLFDDMGLKPSRRTKSGAYTTNASTLLDLYAKSGDNERANTFLGALLRHRETNKLKQIVQTLIDSVDANDQRIHTTYEQTVAATGRLSSVDPNLQNIPNRNAAGREIRSAFIAAKPCESLLSCDYSQVELRIMAHLSGDEALIEAFRSGMDFHKYVASLVYGVPVDQITPDERSHVKAMSYGLAYGLSTYGLAQQLKISPAAADVLKDKYFGTFGRVHDYLESLVAEAKRQGYTETMFGRRRYFPALSSKNRVLRDSAERAALNAPIQGSAADIMKIAMIRADQSLNQAGVTSRIILQIHDELVVEIAPGEADKVSGLVADAMEHAVTLSVPLDVSVGIGSDWQKAAH